MRSRWIRLVDHLYNAVQIVCVCDTVDCSARYHRALSV